MAAARSKRPLRRADAQPRRAPSSTRALGWLAIAVAVLGLVLLAVGVGRQPGGSNAAPAPTPGASSPGQSLAGLRVGLDPGHNGGNARRPDVVNELVPDGRGGMKACNTTGTATEDGYPEHAFTWDVALRAKALLERLGAVVLLTRDSDDGVGPCVDERGRFGQEHDTQAVVSIHADGSEDRSLRGFFAIVADPPLHPHQGEPSLALARDLVRALEDAGFMRSPSFPDGLSRRADLAGLNHAQRPAVILELGEMRNEEDAALMSSPEGRQRFAEAVVVGLATWADRTR